MPYSYKEEPPFQSHTPTSSSEPGIEPALLELESKRNNHYTGRRLHTMRQVVHKKLIYVNFAGMVSETVCAEMLSRTAYTIPQPSLMIGVTSTHTETRSPTHIHSHQTLYNVTKHIYKYKANTIHSLITKSDERRGPRNFKFGRWLLFGSFENSFLSTH
ncbi:hypothetical protein AVEN_254670-1 [Araneus ventricosus]|uniref:Uncharacterized protein n=1 Tax=Araneus ventricosus TaxID=182803 RepID=A0A4Y2BG18_ARAVE|nr:hypothetical protein AVEN_254670-1 [Araneus ventricosus]